ncbi:restriction endonuclease [Cystobacter fuscus]|uniref:restriction endonuclease n=1 Tax=Cystobacter fuscus TaxID=43 RepID=UPI0037C135B5
MENSADRLRQLVGLPPSSLCNWDSINEEDFEELCYDVLRRTGIFDERTIRKHGKTRSRDGGRDIEIWSRSRIGKPGVKWIFQCKYLSTSRSLGAGRIDMSDVVEQYGAGGFGVMTNSVIDSTLYDRMDAIAARRGLELMSWSKLELERFITPRRDLLRRYFKHD